MAAASYPVTGNGLIFRRRRAWGLPVVVAGIGGGPCKGGAGDGTEKRIGPAIDAGALLPFLLSVLPGSFRCTHVLELLVTELRLG